MQSRTLFSILAVAVFLLGSLRLSNATPIPTPTKTNPRLDLTANIKTMQDQSIAEAESKIKIQLSTSQEQHSLRAITEKIRRLKLQEFQNYPEQLRLEHLARYLALFDNVVTFQRVIEEFPKPRPDRESRTIVPPPHTNTNTGVPPHMYTHSDRETRVSPGTESNTRSSPASIISQAFQFNGRGEMELEVNGAVEKLKIKDIGDRLVSELDEFYDRWAHKLIATNDHRLTLQQYKDSLTHDHSLLVLKRFRAQWECQSIEEIHRFADQDELIGKKEVSDSEAIVMRIMSSSLLRYIAIQKQLGSPRSVDVEIQRLSVLRSSYYEGWDQLKGLFEWLDEKLSELYIA